MRYMLLIYGPEEGAPAEDSPEAAAEFERWMTYHQRITESGAYLSGEALQPTQTATTVRVRDGEDVVTDGPFAETKEVLGGYYVVDVPDLDAALRWAREMPNVEEGSVEVRPIMEIPTG
jgi:hypothetical protein